MDEEPKSYNIHIWVLPEKPDLVAMSWEDLLIMINDLNRYNNVNLEFCETIQ